MMEIIFECYVIDVVLRKTAAICAKIFSNDLDWVYLGMIDR